jgi:hypothetical protein
MMKVLVACEYSGVVRDAFIKEGHDAMSCDILPTDSKPDLHYQGDVMDILSENWDLMVAHPPCTYLSKAGARWLFPTAGNMCMKRYEQGLEAKEFFMTLLNANIEKKAVENPTPLKAFDLPKHTQAIQPYQFGHPYSKRTLLWLENLPRLEPTKILNDFKPFLPSNTGGVNRGQSYSRGVAKNAHEASKTFQGIADAMAQQWGVF